MSDQPIQPGTGSKHSYSFEGFTLDLMRGCLLHEGQEVKLRPKSFDLLRYLVERSGRLVGRAELMQAIWPDTFVGEESLAQCLMEVRRALQDDSQRFVKTVPRRGYIFLTPVSEPAPPEGVQRAGIRRRNTRVLLLASGLLAAVLGAFLYWRVFPRANQPATLAVLPFRPLSQNDRDEPLELGMADALITKLSNLRQTVVRPTSAVRRYLDGGTDALAAGRQLQTDWVLEGSIQRSADRIRVTVQLLSVRGEKPSWASTFDERFTDIFTVQDLISERVADALTVQLTGEERKRLRKRYTDDAQAYQLYLLGRYHWNKRTSAGLNKGIEYFRQAIAKDLDYAPAYAGLADCYNLLGSPDQGALAPKEAFPEATTAARRAVEIDETLAEAHASLAFIQFHYEWDWANAEKEFRRAFDLNPNYTTLQQWYSRYSMAMGRTEASLAASKRGAELDPVDLPINGHLAWHYFYARQYDAAMEACRRTLELDPNHPLPHWQLGMVYEQKGEYQRAIGEFHIAYALSGGSPARPSSLAYLYALERGVLAGGNPVYLSSLGHAYAVAGNVVEARKALGELDELSKRRYVSPYEKAVIHAGLGENEEAFAWLEKAYGERAGGLVYLPVEPRLDQLRADPRFGNLVKRVGLAP
ncbi:MAG: winged helix-turn-helix domain-containing protein [Acidobacteria bacterium]|nr:winged helix-turn-helix domain-containing protein [Acidobacteriota bacterium]